MVLLGSIKILSKNHDFKKINGGPHGFKIFTDAPFEFVKKQSWHSPAKLFIYRDYTLNSEAKTPNKIQYSKFR